MGDKFSTTGQTNGTLVMPGDEMNGAPRPRRKPADGDGMNGNGQELDAQEETPETTTMPIPQPHNITLRHQDGALTVDWHTAPNGYEVALVRGRNEILNQPCVNPPTTLLTDAVPAGQYCVTVKARPNGQADSAEDECEPCIVKLATPTEIVLAYNEALRRLEVQWQPVAGAQGYRVQVVQVVAEAAAPATSNRWTLGGAATRKTAPRRLQAWVQARGDERYYVDSNIGKSTFFEFTVAGPAWGLFDQSDFDQADFFPEETNDTEGASSVASADEDAAEVAAEAWPLTLIIEAKAGIGYLLDDNVNPPSRGQVADDGLLVHEVAPLAEGCVIIFDDGSAPMELIFDRAADEAEDEPDEFFEETYDLELLFDEDEALEQTLDQLPDDDDDEPLLSLLIPEKANRAYVLDDGVNPPSEGMVTEDGLLVHAIAPQATGCTIQFEDEARPIALQFATA